MCDSKLILGIDPGTATTGFGVIEVKDGELKFIDCGCICTESKLEMPFRLHCIAKDLKKIIRDYKPDLAAVEDLFFFKNAKTALKVGQARGVVLQTLATAKIPISEFTPLQVKQALTGYGRADKRQIQEMVKTILNLADIPKPDDAADALAVAITLGHVRRSGKT